MPSRLEELLDRVGLDAVPRVRDGAAWDAAWAALRYRPVGYAAELLAYQHAYLRGANWCLEDLSLVLRVDGRPCGLWPLALGGPEGAPRLTSVGGPVVAPVFVDDVSPRTVKKLCSSALALLRALAAEHGLAPAVLEQSAHPGDGVVGASEWHQQAMAAGAVPTLRHDLFADLRPSLAEIRATFRKSFRPLINVGLRNWSVFVMTAADANASTWAEFKRLHHDAAGRSTRSDESWALQYAMIETGTGFLVGLREPQADALVGAGYFLCTRDEGLYAIAAYDRSLFDKPLGHVVQQRAIETMKARGVAWYRIGERSFAQDVPAPTAKQVAISAFKQGFASHVLCRHEFALPQPLAGAAGAAAEGDAA